jgi:hypothetical protein
MEALSFNCDSRTGRSVSALGIVKAAALILMAALFLTVARHNSKHGYADNGDYLRLAQIVAAKPHGLSEAWPDAKNRQEWDKRYCKYWLPAWDLNDNSRIDEKTYLSSSWPFIFTANLLNRWAGKGVFNITVPGLVVNLLVFAIVLFTTIRANDIRRVILLLLFYVVFAHNGYQLFASTFYADFYALAGFLMFIIFLYAGIRAARWCHRS